jgi:hypothetical protein
MVCAADHDLQIPYMQRTLDYYQRVGFPPYRCGSNGLGQLYRRTGRREQAQEHLGTATTMLP